MMRRTWMSAVLMVGLALALSPGRARAEETMTGITPDQLTDFLKQQGATVEERQTKKGDPYLGLKYDNLKVALFFLDKEGDAYTGLQFYAGFSSGDKKTSLETINDWNRDHRYCRAYIDKEGDPVIECDLDLTGGVTIGAVQQFLKLSKFLVDKYAEAIGAK